MYSNIWIQDNTNCGFGVAVAEAQNEEQARDIMATFSSYCPDEDIKRLTMGELRAIVNFVCEARNTSKERGKCIGPSNMDLAT